jgi:hypothetical protein
MPKSKAKSAAPLGERDEEAGQVHAAPPSVEAHLDTIEEDARQRVAKVVRRSDGKSETPCGCGVRGDDRQGIGTSFEILQGKVARLGDDRVIDPLRDPPPAWASPPRLRGAPSRGVERSDAQAVMGPGNEAALELLSLQEQRDPV